METETMQAPDTREGHYYVSVIDGPNKALASGPYTTHADALAAVDNCRELARRHDPRAHFAAWGTARLALDAKAPQGVLQKWGYPIVSGADDPDELHL